MNYSIDINQYVKIQDNPKSFLKDIWMPDAAKDMGRNPKWRLGLNVAKGIIDVINKRYSNLEKDRLKSLTSWEVIDIFTVEWEYLTIISHKIEEIPLKELRVSIYNNISKYLGTYEKYSSEHYIQWPKSMTSRWMADWRRSITYTWSMNEYYNED